MSPLFTRLVALLGSKPSRKPAPAPRRTQLGLEVLEGRALPSISPMFLGAVQGTMATQATQMAQTTNQAVVTNVANLQGYSFHMVSSSGKPAHDLVIKTETYNADGSANFTGTWQGYGPNSTGTPKTISGTIKLDAQGNTNLSFSWANGSGGMNTFNGTLTAHPYEHGRRLLDLFPFPPQGDVTTPVPGDGPGHISGDLQAAQMTTKAS